MPKAKEKRRCILRGRNILTQELEEAEVGLIVGTEESTNYCIIRHPERGLIGVYGTNLHEI